MKNLFLITLLVLSSSLAAKAQNNIKPNAQPDSIIKIIPVGEGRHSWYMYTIGGKLQTREDVAERLMAYAPSAVEFHQAKTHLAWTYASAGGFFLSGVAAGIGYVHNNGGTAGFVNGQPGIIYEHHSLAAAYIFTGVATAFLVSTFIHATKINFHSNRAIRLYNQRFE